jgi:hypothetical protein
MRLETTAKLKYPLTDTFYFDFTDIFIAHIATEV